MTKLQEAIAEVKGTCPPEEPWTAAVFETDGWPPHQALAFATILNAAASGALVPASDVQLATALAYQRAADEVLEHKRFAKGIDCAAECILSLAATDALAELNALREALALSKRLRDQYREALDAERNHSNPARANFHKAKQVARAEAAEAEVVRLRKALEKATDSLGWAKAHLKDAGIESAQVNYGEKIALSALQPTTQAQE